MSPFDFFGALDTPNLNLWGVTVQTPIVAAPITVTENGSQFYVLRSGARYRWFCATVSTVEQYRGTR